MHRDRVHTSCTAWLLFTWRPARRRRAAMHRLHNCGLQADSAVTSFYLFADMPPPCYSAQVTFSTCRATLAAFLAHTHRC